MQGVSLVRRLEATKAREVFALACLFYLAVNAPHLTDPPYWDAVMGVYHQGVWLYRNGFHYADLLRQPTAERGGSNVNVFFAFSALFALLLRVLPLKGVFFVFHLANITGAGLTIALFFAMLRPRVGGVAALLWILVAASNPIWTGQVASMYLEVPYTAAATLSVYAFWKGRYDLAGLTCVLSYFLKHAAPLQAAVYLVFGLFWLGRDLYREGHLCPGTLRSALYMIAPYPLLAVLGHWVSRVGFSFPWSVAATKIHIFIYQSPYLYPTIILQVALTAAILATRWFPRRPRGTVAGNSRWPRYLCLYTAGFILSFCIYPISLVRYMIYILFPLAAMLSLLTAEFPVASFGLALSLLAFHALNQEGALLRPLPGFIARSGDRLERSREYLTDLEVNRAACRFLENAGRTYPVVSRWPFTLMLTVPEFGYVKSPLPHVIDADRPTLISGTPSLGDSPVNLANHTVMCLYTPNVFDVGSPGPSLKPRPGDRILWRDQSLPGNPVVIYMRGDGGGSSPARRAT